MKINNTSHVHHHYHYVGTNKIAARLMIGFVVAIMSCGFFFSEPHSIRHHSRAKILTTPGHDFLNSFLAWVNNYLASYANILNSLVSFFGWKKSFLWFWYLHVGWGSLIYFGIPILAIALSIFILKREKLVLPILLMLYMWHHGGSFLLHYHQPWFFLVLVLFFLSPWVINYFRKISVSFVERNKNFKKGLEKLNHCMKLSTVKP